MGKKYEEIERIEPDINVGLSLELVQNRIENGYVNVTDKGST